ncbi:MAG: biopolymer transporter ExbD [Deltaproteobacteria bacterium]|nr:biopolymer transporter ExbD [Deltaproteobacteria bacterium]
MRFIKTYEEEPNISIAPLIDIVFLLLIFFMVTSHFDMASGVQISLPEVAQRLIHEEKKTRVTLVVDKSSEVYLEGQKVEIKDLREKLIRHVQGKEILHLVLQADKEVSHGKVVEIMDLAKSAGIQSIIIAAKWKPEKMI